MRDMCSAGRLRPRPSAGVSSLVAPVASVGLDTVAREDLARVEGHNGDGGRLRGSGTTRPAAWRMRRMVEVEGTGRPSHSRCHAMVAGPASRPPVVSSVRRAMIRSRTASAVRCGLVRGRRDLGSRSSRPPSRYRRRRRCRCPRLIPYSAAAAVTDDCDETTEDGHPVLRHVRDCRACLDSPVTHQVSPMS